MTTHRARLLLALALATGAVPPAAALTALDCRDPLAPTVERADDCLPGPTLEPVEIY